VTGWGGCLLPAREPDPPLRECEWCGADEAPADLDWETRIAGPGEPGEKLVVSGTVVRADGTTPAAGVVLYLYHTNREGVYPRRGDETGNARRHGYLRAWLRTDGRGRYRFTTIRPGAYPGRTEPAHIHVTVLEPGRAEDYLDSFVFDDDPLLTPAERSRLKGRGGSGILRLLRGEDGAWHGTRDIVLMRE
jgi:protocatechuate 3,4-dioxygenase beta subunit